MIPSARRRLLTIVVAAVLAVVLLYSAVEGIDWREVARTVARARPAGLMLVVAFATSTLLIRALRWRLLLEAEGTVSVRTAFLATAAGYLGNGLLPARAGELIRTFMISSRCAIDTAFVLATALTERVADAVALAFIAAVILATTPVRLGWLEDALKPAAVLALIAVMLIVVLPMMESVGKGLLERLPLQQALRPRLEAVMGQGLRGIRAFHDVERLSAFVGLTALIWTLDAVATIAGGAALGLAIPIPAAFLLLACLGLGSALPSTPGYVGIYQFAAVSALTPFGFSAADAIAYILVAQALMMLVMGLFGSVGLLEYRRSMHG